MISFIRRLLGWDCCGEWTQWETYRGEFNRAPRSSSEKNLAGGVDTITFTKHWQERCCTLCGRIQQRELNL